MGSDIGIRAEMVEVCKRLEAKGLIAASDGNVSAKLPDGRILVTPSGMPKGSIREGNFVMVDMDGKLMRGTGKPSSELRMHLRVYREMPEVLSIVHAHPPLLTALSLAGVAFPSDMLPEVWMTIGPVPTAPYATPGTEEVPDSIGPFLGNGVKAMLLERHGSITFGATATEACLRLEKLEHAARTLLYARILSPEFPKPLAPELLEKLRAPGA